MAGLAPDNLRIPGQEEPELPEPQNIEIGDSDTPVETLDENGNTVSIEFPDGSIEIGLNGFVKSAQDNLPPPGWFENLCSRIDDMELSRIADDLLRGIDRDQDSRKEWTEDGASAIRLLGLKLNVPNVGGSVEGAPVEGMSTVRHPIMAQAVLNFQANARSELLPTDGPAKIRDDNNNPTQQEDDLAEAYERDINHYLTVIAKEYYPDTDRMLIPLALRGTAFKKVYFCPLRNRPVSETVDADDLIVNNNATDLKNAKRITHRIEMPQNTIKRMQILNVYREVPLGSPMPADLDAAQREKRDQQGIADQSFDIEDRDREIFECYCELNVKGFEHKIKGKETGLEIPYRVTIDKTSRQVLALVRDYDKPESDLLPERRPTFVKYTFIPGFGFYDIGFLHILGNTTNALTAAWRELLDAGMFACFPGFLVSDAGGRQNTNIFRIPPGGGQLVKTGGLPLNQAVMPLPYKEPSPALMQFTQNMAEVGQRLAGVADLQVGEGQQNMPVGTILAIIEQSTKIENAIHKRLHAAQAEELQLLVECFREHPESFWQRNKKPARPWDQETFEKALDTFDLVPQADPNTSSHTQRIMKGVALKTLQMQTPAIYDVKAVDTSIIRTIGFSQPEQFFLQTDQPNPQIQQAMADTQSKAKTADARMIEAKAKAAETNAKISGGLGGGKSPEELALQKQRNELDAQDQTFTQQRATIEDQNRDADRQAGLTEAQMRLAGDILKQEKQHAHEKEIKTSEGLNGFGGGRF